MKTLIVIGGPTASGKTDIAIRLAQHFGAEILSADSRQFYREMRIGTAKPDAAQLAQVPHHFIDSRSIHDAYNVGDYERDALDLLERLFAHRDVAILTGGSGLFVKALCEGLDAFPEVPLAIRQEVEQFYQAQGLTALQQWLSEVDPEYFSEVDVQNPHRLIRALSVWQASGKPFSSFRRQAPLERYFKPVFIELAWPRALLYERINQRVEQMMAKGLEDEARGLHPFKTLPALNTVGYQELFAHFEGAHSLEEAVALIQQNSRNYAKRQLTWSRRDGFWKHFHPSEWSDMLQYLDFSMEQDIRWAEIALEEEGSTGHRRRLELRSGKNPIAWLEYLQAKKGQILLPPSALQEDIVPWLLHEALHRAEDKSLSAIWHPKWEALLKAFHFIPLPPETITGWELKLLETFQLPTNALWKKQSD